MHSIYTSQITNIKFAIRKWFESARERQWCTGNLLTIIPISSDDLQRLNFEKLYYISCIPGNQHWKGESRTNSIERKKPFRRVVDTNSILSQKISNAIKMCATKKLLGVILFEMIHNSLPFTEDTRSQFPSESYKFRSNNDRNSETDNAGNISRKSANCACYHIDDVTAFHTLLDGPHIHTPHSYRMTAIFCPTKTINETTICGRCHLYCMRMIKSTL